MQVSKLWNLKVLQLLQDDLQMRAELLPGLRIAFSNTETNP
jgi:hypothetical protein